MCLIGSAMLKDAPSFFLGGGLGILLSISKLSATRLGRVGERGYGVPPRRKSLDERIQERGHVAGGFLS